MTRWSTVAAVALPGLILAGLGLAHPVFLAPSTAVAWWQLHVALIPLFPLLAVALWVLLRHERGALAWGARIAAFGYATFYTGLDVLAGIGAGVVTDVEQGGSKAVLELFELGAVLGEIGVYCFAVAGVLTGAVLIRRDGVRAVPGTVLLVASAYPFLLFHIFSPYGVLAQLAIAAGCALLAAARRPEAAVAAPREPVSRPAA